MRDHGDFYQLDHEWGVMKKTKGVTALSVTGYPNMSLQNTPFGHKDSFELKATESWQMQEELSVLPLAG